MGASMCTTKLDNNNNDDDDDHNYDNNDNDNAAWLAQLVERQSAVREVDGSSPRLDQHSGS